MDLLGVACPKDDGARGDPTRKMRFKMRQTVAMAGAASQGFAAVGRIGLQSVRSARNWLGN
jgi:hypothetical protein